MFLTQLLIKMDGYYMSSFFAQIQNLLSGQVVELQTPPITEMSKPLHANMTLNQNCPLPTYAHYFCSDRDLLLLRPIKVYCLDLSLG